MSYGSSWCVFEGLDDSPEDFEDENPKGDTAIHKFFGMGDNENDAVKAEDEKSGE